MNFFKSVFSDSTPAASPEPSPPSSPTAPPSPETTLPPTSPWQFGSTIFKTLASRSESVVDNYYNNLRELGSGFKNETSFIREAATRAVQDLPSRLESGAAIAQESLEAVGQAIDNVGAAVTGIIAGDFNSDSNEVFPNESDGAEGSTSKPYSRIETAIRSLQCDLRTYCDEAEEIGYEDWKLGFRVEEKREKIQLLMDENPLIKKIQDEIVPEKVDEETFWCRYFYRVEKIVKAEEARLRIVKRAILGEGEEELSWDLDEDDNNDNIDNEDKGEPSGVVGIHESGVVLEEERLVDNEKEMSDGRIGSDISIISSQRSSHAEDEFGWDKVEDIGSGHGSPGSGRDLGSVEEGGADLDVEEDDEPVKFSHS